MYGSRGARKSKSSGTGCQQLAFNAKADPAVDEMHGLRRFSGGRILQKSIHLVPAIMRFFADPDDTKLEFVQWPR